MRSRRPSHDDAPVAVRLHRAACRLAAAQASEALEAGHISPADVADATGDALHDILTNPGVSDLFLALAETPDPETYLAEVRAAVRDERRRRGPRYGH